MGRAGFEPATLGLVIGLTGSRAYTRVVAACSHLDHDLCMIDGGVFDHETMLVRRGRELMRKDGVGVVSVDVPELT